jgi:hypothetical protein
MPSEEDARAEPSIGGEAGVRYICLCVSVCVYIYQVRRMREVKRYHEFLAQNVSFS